MPGDPATVWGCLAPGPRPPQHPPPCRAMWLPSRLAPELPAAPRISPGKRGRGAPHGAARGSLAACPHPSGPQRAHREREERGHRGGLPWSELPRGRQTWGRAVPVAELGSCASFPKARLAFIKGGGGAAAGPGPSPELAGQLEADRKVERKHRPRGAAHTVRANLLSEGLLCLAPEESGWRIPGARGSGRRLARTC